MMHTKPGFTLIELLISTAISGVLMTILFMTLTQINRTKKTLDNTISKTTRVALVHNQLERDLMGAFMPIVPEIIEAEPEEKKEEPAKPGEPKKPEAPKKEEKKETKPAYDKIFFSENKGANIQNLTFITNNPMPVYWSKKAGNPQPKIARVIYRLQPDPAHKNSFKLVRQEGSDLNYAAYDPKIAPEKQKFRPYELIDGIKNISAVYYYVPPKKPTPSKPGEKPAEQKEEKIEYKAAKEWGQQPKDQQKTDKPPLPRFVELTVVLWDKGNQRDSTWKFTVPILPPSNPPMPKQEASRQPAQPKTADVNKPTGVATEIKTTQGMQAPVTLPTLPAPATSPNVQPTAQPLNMSFNRHTFNAGIPEGVHVGPHWERLPSMSATLRPNFNGN